MKLLKRVQKLEGCDFGTAVEPVRRANRFFSELMNLPDEDEREAMTTAATLLAGSDVIDKPEPELWARLMARIVVEHRDEAKEWPDSRLAFMCAYGDLETEPFFDDDESKIWLCWLAMTYAEVFEKAPAPDEWRECVLRTDHFNRSFIVPLLSRACPELTKYSTKTYTAWLETKPDIPGDQLLQNLRAFVADIPNQKG